MNDTVIVYCGTVCLVLFCAFLARRTVLDFKRMEEDRKDIRQDAAKKNEQILKQMQNQHELDMMRIEMSGNGNGQDMMTLLQTIAPILLNNKTGNNDMSDESQTQKREETESKGNLTESSAAVESTEDRFIDTPSLEESQPKTALRQWVDSSEGEQFFLKHKKFLKRLSGDDYGKKIL